MKLKKYFLLILLINFVPLNSNWLSECVNSSWGKRLGGCAVGAAGAVICGAGAPVILGLSLGTGFIAHTWNSNNDFVNKLEQANNLQRENRSDVTKWSGVIGSFDNRLQTVQGKLENAKSDAKATGDSLAAMDRQSKNSREEHQASLTRIIKESKAANKSLQELQVRASNLAKRVGVWGGEFTEFYAGEEERRHAVQQEMNQVGTDLACTREELALGLQKDKEINTSVRALVKKRGGRVEPVFDLLAICPVLAPLQKEQWFINLNKSGSAAVHAATDNTN